MIFKRSTLAPGRLIAFLDMQFEETWTLNAVGNMRTRDVSLVPRWVPALVLSTQPVLHHRKHNKVKTLEKVTEWRVVLLWPVEVPDPVKKTSNIIQEYKFTQRQAFDYPNWKLL